MKSTINTNIKKFFILLLCFSFLAFPLVKNDVAVSTSTWETKYDEKKRELEATISDINSEMNGAQGTIGELSERKETLKEEMDSIEEEIKKTDNLITDIKLAISQVEWQIDQNEKKIESLKSQMTNLFREIQKQENTTPLELILSSEDLGEAISRSNNLSRYEVELHKMSVKTQELQKDLEGNKTILQKTEEDLESTKALQKSKEEQLETLIRETEGDEAKYKELLNSLAEEERKFKAEIAQNELDRESERLAIQKAEEEKRRNCEADGGTYKEGVCHLDNGGGGENPGSCVNQTVNYDGIPDNYFIEPVTGFITQGFGCVGWGNGAHDGIDVANSTGTPIKAAASGSVVHSGWLSGYGYSVIIKHSLSSGRRIYTVYAHMYKAPSVSKNQSVTQGQVVGYLGSTGYSTGPHLHFSIADESYEWTGTPNCNPRYGTTYTYCFNPRGSKFALW